MYRITLEIPVTGVQSGREAERMAEAMLERLGESDLNDDGNLKLRKAYYRFTKEARDV